MQPMHDIPKMQKLLLNNENSKNCFRGMCFHVICEQVSKFPYPIVYDELVETVWSFLVRDRGLGYELYVYTFRH